MLLVGAAITAPSACLSRSSPSLPSPKPSPAISIIAASDPSEERSAAFQRCLPRDIRCCPCGRRHLMGASAAAALLPVLPVKAVNCFEADSSIQKFHPARPDWYEELFAKAMDECMRSYEAEIAGYKADLFSRLTGASKKVLELGVGTGPNFKYYARAADLYVVGVDPNKQMEKYARGAALAAGLPPLKFTFMQGVGEDLPVEDCSVDAVIGTLVLCSVKDVNITLQAIRERDLYTGAMERLASHIFLHNQPACCSELGYSLKLFA